MYGLEFQDMKNVMRGDYVKCVYAHGNAYKLGNVYRVNADHSIDTGRLGRCHLVNENGIKCHNSLSRFVSYDPMEVTHTIFVKAGDTVTIKVEAE